MLMKLKTALLLCLMSAAALALCGAYRSLRPFGGPALPEEVAARFVGRDEDAAYFLREEEGYVAVFVDRRERESLRRTEIEASSLRAADRLLLQKGIPAGDNLELLSLLEDLGS
ncbi:MAG: hypothetical protein IJT29_02685 [Oscillospiraceae bacterium]|nr:hypothetical protein [Oscillospiraceae bacterium]